MVRERDKLVSLLLGIRRLPSSSCEGLYIVSGVLFLSLMVKRYFVLLWWHEVAAWSSPPYGRLTGIVVGDAAVKDRGKTCCHFILSSHPAGGGTWAMTGCCGNVWDLLTSVNDPDHCIRMTYANHPDVLCKSSGWYVYKCCLIFLEVVRKSVPCVLYRKIRMRVTRMTMRVMCHCKMRATCSRREGSLQYSL